MDIPSEGNVMFAITLLKKLCEENPRNVVFSPPSISFVLNMIFLGTKRETAAQIAKLLSLNRNGDIYLGFQSLLAEMNKPSAWYLLKTTNKLFGENALNFLMSFRDSCFKFCNSVMEDVCFSQEAEAMRKHINAWVAEKTAGNILEALPDGLIDPLSLLVLVNAINFKATWERAFDPRHTYTNLVKVNQVRSFLQDLLVNHKETNALVHFGMWSLREMTRWCSCRNSKIPTSSQDTGIEDGDSDTDTEKEKDTGGGFGCV
ncbi:serpin B6-like [Gracilinanus agilis]|uniref:serpin B6-like n=1 Tax=Gracilinanus agilis TaxID=191870 RepID=UPI001CFEF117|nr:serpin B6-like [Gracilinanus agilis]